MATAVYTAEVACAAKQMHIEEVTALLKKLRGEHTVLAATLKQAKLDARERKAAGKVAEPRVYKNNAANRALGRAGKPVPPKPKLKKTTATTQKIRRYKDNAANRRLGRVGKPIRAADIVVPATHEITLAPATP